MERTEFLTEPVRTLCLELRGDHTVIPREAWLTHGEEEPDFEGHHIDLENLPEEAFYYDRHENLDCDEVSRDPKANQAAVVQAGSRLMDILNLSNTRAMCDVVGQYMVPAECRMDGVILYFLKYKQKEEVVEATLEFTRKIANYLPETSKEARKRLVKEMRKEWKERQNDGPAFRLSQALHDTNLARLAMSFVP